MRKLDRHRCRVTGTSQSLPRVLIVDDEQGRKLLYFAATGRLSREPLRPAREADLFDWRHGHQHWKPVADSVWVDVDELRNIAVPGDERYRRRLVAHAKHG